MAEQLNLCEAVPTAAKHNWHLLSLMFHAGTLALRAWVHWPPESADIASARYEADQNGTCFEGPVCLHNPEVTSEKSRRKIDIPWLWR